MKRITNKLVYGDIYLLWLMNYRIRCFPLDKMMPLITHLGGTIITISFTLSLILFGNNKLSLLGAEIAISLSISQVIVQTLKRKVNRPRPHTVLDIIEKFNVPICNYSFPSGHTATAFTITNLLAFYLPNFMILFTAIAVLIALSRIYLGVHYPSDVIVGFIIALISSLVTHYYFWRFF